MQNPTTVQTPGAPIPVDVSQVGQTRPITQAEIGVIRRQRSEMSNQLSSAQDRREELVNQIRVAPNGTEQGMLQQLRVLDQRIVNIEQDLERSGQTLRSGQVPVGTTIVPPRSFEPSAQVAAERGAMISAMVLVPIMLVYMVSRFVRRGKRRARAEANSADHDARMERLEQAVDAIALEIERVGESQRYQTKANLMPALNAGQRAAEPIRMKEFEEIRERR
jgi:hypothetical protein